jgi:hypothetical protein
VLTSRVDNHLNKMVAIFANFQFLRGKIIAVEILANLNSCEELSELFEFHPKRAIIFFGQANLFLCFWSPGVGFVTPSACPLEASPWVTDLNKFNSLSLFVLNYGS